MFKWSTHEISRNSKIRSKCLEVPENPKNKNKLLKLVKELRAIKITFSLHNHAFEYFPLNIF